ncbi:hypothetical protein GN956_G6685 [Arapaima gigas]
MREPPALRHWFHAHICGQLCVREDVWKSVCVSRTSEEGSPVRLRSFICAVYLRARSRRSRYTRRKERDTVDASPPDNRPRAPTNGGGAASPVSLESACPSRSQVVNTCRI